MSKLKVLHLFNSYLPQTQNWAYDLITNTPDIEIVIGARRYLKNNFYSSTFHYISNPFASMQENGKMLEGHFSFRAINRIYSFVVNRLYMEINHLYRRAKQEDVNIVHAHFANTAWFFHQIPHKLKIPFVVSFYGWDYEQLPYLYPKYKKHFITLFQKADVLICEGHHGASILKRLGCPHHKIKVVHLGVRPAVFPYVERKKENRTLQLIQVASYTEKKGHIYTIKAFQKALKICPNLKLTLVGNEKDLGLKASLIQYIQTNKLHKNIEIVAEIDFKNLAKYLVDFHIFIHPSCYSKDRDCEGGAPIVLLNAQATGLPVISTWHCDIPEEVLNNKTGLLVNPKDINALADAILKFYNMPQKEYNQYAQNARKHIENHFDIHKNAKDLRVIYEQLLA